MGLRGGTYRPKSIYVTERVADLPAASNGDFLNFFKCVRSSPSILVSYRCFFTD